MAKKGTKYKKYSPDLKKQILNEYFNGEGGWKALGKKYGIPHQTINSYGFRVKIYMPIYSYDRKKYLTRTYNRVAFNLK